MATNIAIQNDENRNPAPTIAAVISSMSPLITMVNSPNVNKLIGNDKIVKIGFTNQFKTTSTTDAIAAIPTLATKKLAGKKPLIATNKSVSTTTVVRNLKIGLFSDGH